MPMFNVYLPAGRYTSDEKKKLASALHRALVEALGVPTGDQFCVMSEHKEDELFIHPTFPDLKRTDRAMLITVIHGDHRALEQKRKLAELVTKYAVESVGVAEDDIMLNMMPFHVENFSFGKGLLQLADKPPTW